MSKYDELNKLEDLRRNGTISEEEFQREKARILDSGSDNMLGMDTGTYLLLMHLSQFTGPLIPLVMWLVNKNDPEVDRHGRNIMNFIISMAIYAVAGVVLSFIYIGIPILLAIGVLEIVFVIMAAVKAGRGEYWKYPLSITFLP